MHLVKFKRKKNMDLTNSLFFIFLKSMPSFFFILKRDNYISQAHAQLSAQLSTWLSIWLSGYPMAIFSMNLFRLLLTDISKDIDTKLSLYLA